MSADGSARHGPPLAPQSFRLALDQEIAPPSRKARSGSEHSCSHSAHAPSQPLVGCTPHPRRAAQIGDCGGTIHGGQIFASVPQTAFPGRTFLTNHLAQTAAIDFFTVPTATFRVLFVFIVLAHERRRVVHFGVTEHPTQEWTRQQMREAFPWDEAPRYVLRDRDAIYGSDFATMTRNMGVEEVLTAPRSPWRNPFAERLVGSIRRECLDHVIVWNERSLRRTLQNYLAYYQRSRTHLALGKDSPAPRAVEPPEQGRVIAIPQVGGLHHRYQRRAA
jgi:putative transposase